MDALDALGSPVRRDILRALGKRPLAVNELSRRFPVSRPAISRHLRLLEEAGLVTSQASGKQTIYAVRVEGFASVRAFIDEFWDSALGRLTALGKISALATRERRR